MQFFKSFLNYVGAGGDVFSNIFLPKTQYRPPLAFELYVYLFVSLHVSSDFFDPVLGVSFWDTPTFTKFFSMPKLGVREYGELFALKNYVGFSTDGFYVFLITQTASVELFSKHHLYGGVFGFYFLHDLRSGHRFFCSLHKFIISYYV